ncbi:hypothetical protein D1007_35261 [Hordeum vulgare]|nr:hypothetical protein D1007_35261 [Hordeum vulgare]
MLVIPPKFMEVMKEWVTVKLLHVVGLLTNKWCKLWVQIQNFEGQMVLGRGWQYFYHRHMIIPDNLIMLCISGLGLKVQIYNHDNSIRCRVRCSKHN